MSVPSGRDPMECGQGAVRDSPTRPGQNAKSTVTGSTRKTTGTIIRISRRDACLDELTTAGLADVAGLRMEYVGQRRAALDGDRDTVREARDDRHPGRRRKPVEGIGNRLTSADGGQHRGEIGGQRAPGAAHDAVERGHRALAGSDGERQQLGDGRELLEHRPLALAHLSGQVLVAGEDAG